MRTMEYFSARKGSEVLIHMGMNLRSIVQSESHIPMYIYESVYVELRKTHQWLSRSAGED